MDTGGDAMLLGGVRHVLFGVPQFPSFKLSKSDSFTATNKSLGLGNSVTLISGLRSLDQISLLKVSAIYVQGSIRDSPITEASWIYHETTTTPFPTPDGICVQLKPPNWYGP